jgi:hypothetical protein
MFFFYSNDILGNESQVESLQDAHIIFILMLMYISV